MVSDEKINGEGPSSDDESLFPSGGTESEDAPKEEDWKDEDFLSFDDNQGTAKPAAASLSSSSSKPLATPLFNHETDLPPWMERAPQMYINPLIRLHNEIVQFTNLVGPTQEETRERQALVERIRTLVDGVFENQKVTVEVFGSLATGLFLPSSDIDLVVTTTGNDSDMDEDSDEEDREQGNSSSGPSDLQKVAQAFREEWLSELSYLEVIENTRVPLVKLTHAPTSWNIDICFNQDKGVPAANLMVRYLKDLPPLKPLSFVLKYFLALRELNEPYSGGVGSFLMQLLVVSFLQQREREAAQFQRPVNPNLGAMLLEFLELFGGDLNYITTGISVLNDGSFFPKGAPQRRESFFNENRLQLLAVENPLDTTMDVGTSSFRFQMVQRAFATAHKMLLAYLTAPELKTKSFLATILPPNDERLWARQSAKESETQSLLGSEQHKQQSQDSNGNRNRNRSRSRSRNKRRRSG